jgi:hypothetical protein
MSAMGQTRRFRDVRDMSGLPQTTDIAGPGRHFAFVPIGDIVGQLFDHLVGARARSRRGHLGRTLVEPGFQAGVLATILEPRPVPGTGSDKGGR